MNIQTSPYSTPYPGFQTQSMPGDRDDKVQKNGASRVPVNSAGEMIQPEPVGTESANKAESGETAVDRTGTGSETAENGLTQAELRLVTELKQADSEVRRHEMAHIAAAGGLALSGANFTFQRGPDGVNYAVAGEVSIDTAPVPGDPKATIQKMQKVKNAALAPANPSAQDVKVASKASAMASKALSELMTLQAEEQARANEETAFGSSREASEAYVRVKGLPEKATHSFQLAV
ncbi:putative metalloprotease CJM1_0395 family protein [Desulfospira joergensenii]|uniref:putative metalloprotease CJM1_0395 family protein n=1 Tax=Desulfospira joergensenii TaxID=53329 RepID=UPI0003B35887|nr:putative metalloprotease CJM1_0395 family protein [Desulfospira joergensenii]